MKFVKMAISDPFHPNYEKRITDLNTIGDLHDNWLWQVQNELPGIPGGWMKESFLLGLEHALIRDDSDLVEKALFKLMANWNDFPQLTQDPDFLDRIKTLLLPKLKDAKPGHPSPSVYDNFLSTLGGTSLYDDPEMRPHIRSALSRNAQQHLTALDEMEKGNNLDSLRSFLDRKDLNMGPFPVYDLLNHYARRDKDFVKEKLKTLPNLSESQKKLWLLRSRGGFGVEKHALLKSLLPPKEIENSSLLLFVQDYILDNEVMDHDPEWVKLVVSHQPRPLAIEQVRRLAWRFRANTLSPATAAFLETQKKDIVDSLLHEIETSTVVPNAERLRESFFFIDQFATDGQLKAFMQRKGLTYHYLAFLRRIAGTDQQIIAYLAAPNNQKFSTVKNLQDHLQGAPWPYTGNDGSTTWMKENLLDPRNLARNEEWKQRYESALKQWRRKLPGVTAVKAPAGCQAQFAGVRP